jgi:hypothetical protein
MRKFVTVAVPVVLTAIVTWWLVHPQPGDRFPVDQIEGVTTWVNSSGSAIGLRVTDGGSGFVSGDRVGLDVAVANNRRCVVPLSGGQRLALGVIKASPSMGGPGADLVVWVECLGPPDTF